MLVLNGVGQLMGDDGRLRNAPFIDEEQRLRFGFVKSCHLLLEEVEHEFLQVNIWWQ